MASLFCFMCPILKHTLWSNELGYYSDELKTNANYGNLVSDKVEKRVAKNLLCDSCWSPSWTKKVF